MTESERHRKLVNYFKKNLSKGYTEDSLKYSLLSQGYSRTEVENAIKKTHLEFAKKAPELKEKPMIKYQIINEYDLPVKIRKPWWKKFLGF